MLDALDSQELTDLYQQLWPGKVTQVKQKLFLEKLKNQRPETIRKVLRDLATWREAGTRPTVGQVITACQEEEARRAEREPGLDDGEMRDPISLREWVRRVEAGERRPTWPWWEGGGSMPDGEVRRGVAYLRSIMESGGEA